MLRDSACLALLLAVSAALPAHSQPASGPQAPLSLEARGYTRQLWLIPAPEKGVLMRTNLFRPAGEGPFPLVVINHGSTGRAEERAKFVVPVYPVASEFFLARGYAVMLPQRPGHGETGGTYLEGTQGNCANPDYRRSGLAAADAIAAAIDFMTRQSFIKPDGVIVVGQSAGGWGALALGSRNPKNVKAVVNFAGGFGGHVHGRPNNNCGPDNLVEAAGFFGAAARIPVLSLYAENDTFFPPDLSKRLNKAYRDAGGRVDFRLLPPFEKEGHRLIAATEGVAIWGPIVDEFLKSLK